MPPNRIEPVEFTPEEAATLRSLAASLDTPPKLMGPILGEEAKIEFTELFKDQVRAIVREEIASLAGLALRRTQDQELSRSPDRNTMTEIANRENAQFWGEVLAEYSA